MRSKGDDMSKAWFARILGGLALVSSLGLQGCDLDVPTSAVLEDAYTYTGHIRLSLAHPYNLEKDDYELVASVPFDVKSMFICVISAEAEPCNATSQNWFYTDLFFATNTRRFFRQPKDAYVRLQDGLILQFMSVDSSGKTIDTRRVTYRRVGGATTPTTPTTTTNVPTTPSTTPSTTPNGGGQGGPVTVDQIRGIVQTQCAQSCHPAHPQYGANPEVLKNVGAADRIRSGNMPQGSVMNPQDKDLLLRYLSGG